MAIEDDGRLFIPNAKRILEVLEKMKSYKQQLGKDPEDSEEEHENNVKLKKIKVTLNIFLFLIVC